MRLVSRPTWLLAVIAASTLTASCVGRVDPGAGASSPGVAVSSSQPPSSTGDPGESASVTTDPAPGSSPSATPGAPSAPTDAALLVRTLPEQLVSPGVAATQTHDQLLALIEEVDAVAVGAVRDQAAAVLVAEAQRDGPIILGEVDLGWRPSAARAMVRANLVLALPTAPGRIVLRSLAVTDAVATSARVDVRVTVRGVQQEVRVQPGRDRVVVRIAPEQRAAARAAGHGLTLAIAWQAPVPGGDDLVAGEGPGSHRLYSATPDVVSLGHWLPVPVAMDGNAGAVPPWGDLGAFAAATWIVEINAARGQVRTGGVDWPLPASDDTTRQVALGWGLRDLAAVWLRRGEPMHPDDAPVAATSDRGQAVVVATPASVVSGWVVRTSGDQLALFDELYGPTPWQEHDVVRVEMDGALGMEFPGLVLVDDSAWQATDLGRFVLAHEWGHQWFHAHLGNGSLSDPAVDEPLAQYVTWRWFRDEFGAARAATVAAQFIAPQPNTPQRTDQPGSAFPDADSYRIEIYQRGPTGWIRAAEQHGTQRVDDVLAALVDEFGLGAGVTTRQLLDEVHARDAAIAAVLVETWAAG